MAALSLLLSALIVLAHVNCQEIDVRKIQIANGCQGAKMDLFFLLDSSSSIPIGSFRRLLQLARAIVARLDVRPKATRVGALSFSDDYERPVMGLTRFSSRQDAVNGINVWNLPYRTGITNPGLAIRYVNEQNDFRKNINKVVVLMTNGGSKVSRATVSEAERARENGFYLFVVGVGQYLDEREWRAIANDPDEQFLYNVTVTGRRPSDSVATAVPWRACSLPP